MRAALCLTCGAALALILFSGTSPAVAGAPWRKLALFTRIEADPRKEYRLGEDNGPWMILAVTFSGPHAAERARELVYELRSRYKLPAYTHSMSFDFTGTVHGRGIDQFGEPITMRYNRDNRIDEIAVMVGDYPAVDDPDAQRTLKQLKYAQPACLQIRNDKPVSRSLAALREIQKQLLADGNEKKEHGPLGHAFMTTNPILPREYFVPEGIDPFVLEMNADVPYSLLDCPGKYSVQVASFKGHTIIDPKQLEEVEEGAADVPSELAAAAEKARILTDTLRSQGVEAYEFHDRYTSIVTVGSFESVGVPLADGRIEINPQILAIMKRYGTAQDPASRRGGFQQPGTVTAKTINKIPLDPQPIPVAVPRRSISGSFRQTGYRPR